MHLGVGNLMLFKFEDFQHVLSFINRMQISRENQQLHAQISHLLRPLRRTNFLSSDLDRPLSSSDTPTGFVAKTAVNSLQSRTLLPGHTFLTHDDQAIFSSVENAEIFCAALRAATEAHAETNIAVAKAVKLVAPTKSLAHKRERSDESNSDEELLSAPILKSDSSSSYGSHSSYSE